MNNNSNINNKFDIGDGNHNSSILMRDSSINIIISSNDVTEGKTNVTKIKEKFNRDGTLP